MTEPETAASWADFAGLVRAAPAAVATTIGLSAITLGASIALPAVSALSVQNVLEGNTSNAQLAVLAGLLVLRTIAEAFGAVARASAVTRIAASLRHQFVRTAFAQGLPLLRRHAFGDLVSRLTGNVRTAAYGVAVLIGTAVGTIASLAGLCALWLIDWVLGAVFVIVMLPALLVLRRPMREAGSSWSTYQAHLGEIAARLGDALTGYRTIRASGTSAREVDRVLGPLPDLVRSGSDALIRERSVTWRSDLVLLAVSAAVLVTAGLEVLAGRLSGGGLLACVMYLGMAVGIVDHADSLLHVVQARVNAARVNEILGFGWRSPAPSGRTGYPPPARPEPPAALSGPAGVAFRDVVVRVAGRVLLDHVSFDIPAGSCAAVVGAGGAGKSVLAMLVGGLLQPTSGTVLIDGKPVRDMEPDDLPRQVAYAFERPFLLGETIGDALGLGSTVATPAMIGSAARMAQAADFIDRLPDGFGTAVTAANFSGGELQRLGLARALAQQSRILVLDDATSSLDTVTEKQVSDAITQGMAGRTRLIVAHRASTAARADLVVWLQGGRIRSVATHGDLLSEPDYRTAFGFSPAVPAVRPANVEHRLVRSG